MKALDLTGMSQDERFNFIKVYTRQHPDEEFYVVHVGLLDKPEEQRTLLVDKEMERRLMFYRDFLSLMCQNGKLTIMVCHSPRDEARRKWEKKLKPSEIYVAKPDPKKGKGWFVFEPVKLSSLPVEKAEPPSPNVVKQVEREMAEEEFREKVETARREIEQKYGVKLEVAEATSR